jgi:hypothetical protein
MHLIHPDNVTPLLPYRKLVLIPPSRLRKDIGFNILPDSLSSICKQAFNKKTFAKGVCESHRDSIIPAYHPLH